MYLPPQFDSRDQDHACALMRTYPFASLISCDDSGLPYVSHIPLHLQERGAQLVLLGHVAKPNPHWRYLQDRPAALVTFLGPHSYMSPQVYPDLVRVPTWSYLAVHCKVQASLVQEPQAKDRLLKTLIADHEPAYAAQWRSLGEEFQQKMLSGIVGFELLITDLQCKLKLNQHRPEAHDAMKAVYSGGSEQERALAHWMDKLGLGSKPKQDAN
ncbi:MAG: FMN-binding negative transcriptional regulator [Burkholderiaceae bacterium]